MGDRSLDDEDFEYGGQGQEVDYEDDDDGDFGHESKPVQNQPHDEEVALSDTDSFGGGPDSPPGAKGMERGPYDASLIESQDMDDMAGKARPAEPPQSYNDSYEPQQAKPTSLGTMPKAAEPPQRQADPSEDGTSAPGGYNALEFKHLNVSDEIRELFKYIGRYKAHTIDLETKLKPFIPDYIPSVGGIDEFIKVPRPDGKPDFLGLKVLDEPASRQSDPTVLTLQLRQNTKEAGAAKAEMIGRIDHVDGNKNKKIAEWVSSIGNILKTKPAANVSYSRRMPEIEDLMQEWPPEMEAFLKNMKMPSGELDIDLKTYTKMMCGILDIPVYENPIESLHVLFSLYLEFKSNPIFKQQLDMDPGFMSGGSMMGAMGEEGAGTPAWAGGMASIGQAIGNMSLPQGMASMGSAMQDSNGANVMTFG